ncbi:hypothetical protein BHE74_00034323 [Ensete ventricosum]|nr:hypothetical protein BHE74_00034323 [Ensete ventricosum]
MRCPRPCAVDAHGLPTRRRRPRVAHASSPPTGHPCAVAALARGRFFSRVRRRNVSTRGEKDQGDLLC